MLSALLVATLVAAVFRARSLAMPIAIAVFAGSIALLLLTKPATGQPTPDLTGTGRISLALSICLTLLAVAHAMHLRLARRAPVASARSGAR